jgi:DNA replication protein DnaC
MIIGSMGSGKTQLGFSILNEVKTNYGINTFYLTSSQLIKDSEDTL